MNCMIIKQFTAIGIMALLGMILLIGANAYTRSFKQESTVHMTDEGFVPNNISIKSGEKVTFKSTGQDQHWPASNIHPTHEIYSEFDPRKPISSGAEWSFVFDQVGTWRFHDHLYPQFHGTITVKTTNFDLTHAKNITGKGLFQKIFERIRELLANIFHIFSQDDSSSPLVVKDSDFRQPQGNNASNPEELFSDDAYLRSYIGSYGPSKALTELSTLSSQQESCHPRAHEVGRISYEIYEEGAFAKCSAECQSGCYHGAVESYFKKNGTVNLAGALSGICNPELNSFFMHQCLHGIGHGLMAWTNYELFDALNSCDLISAGRESCYTGVFMENIVGGIAGTMGHFTKYMSDDPHYPCNVIDGKYKSACYFYQTSRMTSLFNGDFSKVARACKEAPPEYQRSCFESMGRDSGGRNRQNPKAAITACANAPYGNQRIWCLAGAVQDTFWDSSGQDTALKFCESLIDHSEKKYCYETVFERAKQVLNGRKNIESFCNKTESDYQRSCNMLK